MNILYLSPHYPAHYSLFSERLAAYGVKVLGVTDRRDEELPAPLLAALAGNYRVDTLESAAQVMKACDHYIAAFGKIDRVESHLESWLELEAAIREKYDVPGPRPADLPFIKQKSLMKETFARGGVPTARGAIVEDWAQALSFIDGNYPVFIKPDTGVGASDTYTIRSEEELYDFFRVKSQHLYFMEELLEGVIESFDGLTDREGRIIFHTSHVFSNDIHKIVKLNENLSYYSRREIPADLVELGTGAVRAAKIREKFFHVEFFRLPDGSLKGLEINVRPPGGLTTHMFNYACDIDVYDWWAALMAGHDAPDSYERWYHVAYVSRKQDRTYVLSHDEIVRHLGPGLLLTQPMNPIEYQVMGQVGYLVRSPNLDEVKEMIRLITLEAP